MTELERLRSLIDLIDLRLAFPNGELRSFTPNEWRTLRSAVTTTLEQAEQTPADQAKGSAE